MAVLGSLDYDEKEFDRTRTNGGGKTPPGEYNVEIVKCEQKRWDDGGVTLSLHCKIMDGEHEGSIHYYRFNVVHKNEKAQGIARSQLHRVCELVEAPWPLTDDDALMGGVFRLAISYNTQGYVVENASAHDNMAPSTTTGDAPPAGKPGKADAGAAKSTAGASSPW